LVPLTPGRPGRPVKPCVGQNQLACFFPNSIKEEKQEIKNVIVSSYHKLYANEGNMIYVDIASIMILCISLGG
jgi:hypothetical protein